MAKSKETKDLKSGDTLTIDGNEVSLLTKCDEGWLCNVTRNVQNGGPVTRITQVEVLTEKQLNA